MSDDGYLAPLRNLDTARALMLAKRDGMWAQANEMRLFIEAMSRGECPIDAEVGRALATIVDQELKCRFADRLYDTVQAEEEKP